MLRKLRIEPKIAVLVAGATVLLVRAGLEVLIRACQEARDRAERDSWIAGKAAEARATGRPVDLQQWLEACDGSVSDCGYDRLQRQVHPDGTITKVRTHTRKRPRSMLRRDAAC